METNLEIIKFIKKFTHRIDGTKRNDVIECFTEGCCFWFADILDNKFENGYLLYDYIEGHFVYYNYKTNMCYDITGAVEKKNSMLKWSDILNNDPAWAKRITHNCINLKDD